MKKFFGFVTKETYHILRDKRSLLILFGMPIVQVLLFGFAITNEVKNIKVGILDQSKDEVTHEIQDKLFSSGYFQKVANIQSTDQIEKTFQKGEIKEVLIFEPGFGKNLHAEGKANVQIITDATDPNLADKVVAFTTSILQDYQRGINQTVSAPLTIIPEIEMRYNPQLESVYMFVPGVITIILMLVSALMTSISIAREKEKGTMEVLKVSPLNGSEVIIGKVIPYLGLSFINTVVILMLGVFVFGMPIQGNVVLLLAEAVLFIITALSLGILISTIAQTQQTAMMMSMMGLMLPTIMLSGFIFPVESMPNILQWLSNIVPATWFIIIIKNIMLKGTGFAYVWQETAILLGMTLFFIIVSVRKFKL